MKTRKEPGFRWNRYGLCLLNRWATAQGLSKARGFGLAALGGWRLENLGFDRTEPAFTLACAASAALSKARPTENDDPPTDFVKFEMYVQQEVAHGTHRTLPNH